MVEKEVVKEVEVPGETVVVEKIVEKIVLATPIPGLAPEPKDRPGTVTLSEVLGGKRAYPPWEAEMTPATLGISPRPPSGWKATILRSGPRDLVGFERRPQWSDDGCAPGSSVPQGMG